MQLFHILYNVFFCGFKENLRQFLYFNRLTPLVFKLSNPNNYIYFIFNNIRKMGIKSKLYKQKRNHENSTKMPP